MSSDPEVNRIEKVDPSHAQTMRANPTTFTPQALPFYARHRLLSAVVRLRHKPLLLEYLDDGRAVLPLTPEAIKRVNALERLELSAATAGPYARFFLAHAAEPRARVVESPSDVPWLPACDTDPKLKQARDQSLSFIHALRVTPEFGAFSVVASAMRERKLVEVTLTLERDGKIASLFDDVTVEELPVRYVA